MDEGKERNRAAPIDAQREKRYMWYISHTFSQAYTYLARRRNSGKT